ncbi:hypothetical protein ACFXAZ_36735 [Streptomyces sp. NPDC059477]|uniref:hypothetical protein n=1 Tax=Streptomyces sp. NPDC059477 TaxID=3346847 RepID=UPI0036C96966
MKTRTTTLAALLALTVLTAGCSKSQDEIAEDCQAALATVDTTQLGDDRPAACDGLSDDDYNALRISAGLRDSGIVDDNGNVDVDELLEDSN